MRPSYTLPPRAKTHGQEQNLDAVGVLGVRGVCLQSPANTLVILAQWKPPLNSRQFANAVARHCVASPVVCGGQRWGTCLPVGDG